MLRLRQLWAEVQRRDWGEDPLVIFKGALGWRQRKPERRQAKNARLPNLAQSVLLPEHSAVSL